MTPAPAPSTVVAAAPPATSTEKPKPAPVRPETYIPTVVVSNYSLLGGGVGLATTQAVPPPTILVDEPVLSGKPTKKKRK